jgi:hypothetical protein
MPLRMKSLRIQGFKAIGDATLYWHPRVNVITGPNNSGKTTVLEALALWVESFDRVCTQARRAIKDRGVRSGDWHLDTARAHHSEVVSVRSPGFDDLFHRGVKQLYLTATLTDDDGDFAIPFQIRKARGDNYDFSCATKENDPAPHLEQINTRLNRGCAKWPRPFRVLFASPVAAVQTSEEFFTPGKTADMVRRRRSAEVLRNRIYRLYGRANDFQRFKDDVSQVLTGGPGGIDIEVRGDPNNDVRVPVLARTSPRDHLRDISLLGSGSLQVIEVLLNLYLAPSDLDLVLLDEPDSHIHRDIQRRLLGVIEDKAEYAQVFASTHNESLLRNAGWDRVFHLGPAPADAPREFRPVASEHVINTGLRHGLLASPLRNALSSVGAETALDFLNALEADQFLLVEGPSDAILLDRMFEISRLGGPRQTAMYWSLNGIEGLRSLRALKAVLSHIQNDRSLWDKARVILDRDLCTEQHAEAIVEALGTAKSKKAPPFGIQASFWAAYTAEAVLLSGGPSAALARTLAQVGATNPMPDLDEKRAQQACEHAWVALGGRLVDRWNKIDDIARFHGELDQRAKLFGELFRNRSVLPGAMGQLQEEVVAFHRAALANEQYWQSATKTDVLDFVAEVFEGMSVKREAVADWRQGPSWFQAIITQLRTVSDFPALRSMREALH